ncbi:hypothetical protein H9636_18840 [Ureibacillus sp. Re31]|uniref:Uncharacterized protein n=1 Tax=Ureibacillus galli TaxID=2762222 RepID=A0ABR8XHJ6_9BACL|nr:hypothetical protein [Ureibacillus galli]MBD8028688.1 hypothetical protein [Ureibacillus galli]
MNEYPVGEEKLIMPEVPGDQYVTDEEFESIKAMFKAREDLTETLTGDELRVRLNEIMDDFLSVKASLEMEGLTVTREMVLLILAEQTGAINFEEFSKRAKEYSEKLK